MKASSIKAIIRPLLLSTSFTCFFLLFSLASLDIVLRVYSYSKHPGSRHFDADVSKYPHVKENYLKSGLSISDTKELLKETWVPNGWEYTPVLGFKETARSGKFVNISGLGFRLNSPKEPLAKELISSNKKIYVFGGSTTFGYGVQDSATIPAHLSKMIPSMRVFNFGRGYYFSEQENFLFDELISSSISKPKLAIFVDGVNERCGNHIYLSEMKSIFTEVSSRNYNWSPREFMKPVSTILSKLGKNRQGLRLSQRGCRDRYAGSSITLPEKFKMSLDKRAALCDLHRIRCLTYIQPFPGYKNVHIHGTLTDSAVKKAQELSRVSVKSGFHETVDITSALSELKEHAYVDNVHYSSSAMQTIARRIYLNIANYL